MSYSHWVLLIIFEYIDWYSLEGHAQYSSISCESMVWHTQIGMNLMSPYKS
jgi:hypothetical protein